MKRYDSYKDSGVEWIGDIPNHWDRKRLKNISESVNGYSFKSDDFDREYDIPVIRIGDVGDSIDFDNCVKVKSHFLEEKSEFIVKKDDILIGLTEGTEEGSKRLIEDIVNDDEFKNVITSNNTDSNKRDKLQKIISDKNIKTLDINHKLYDYFEKEDVREKMIRMFISRPELLNQLRG